MKTSWEGKVIAVQPRIRLLRSFDQRSHSYLGYVLRVSGMLGAEKRDFLVALGKVAHEKYQFRAGDQVSGLGEAVEDERMETADLYKVSALKLHARGAKTGEDPPPFLGAPPTLETYRARGHRRLSPKTYASKCTTCFWGSEMSVEMVIDQWKFRDPANLRYRRETFCYGPKSCAFYKPGPPRKVPGREMNWIEDDWVDEETTRHRGVDD